MTGAMVMSDVGVRTADDIPVTRLLMMGQDLTGKPAAFVTFSRGYYKEPLKWAVQ
ncbi:hypothetical protein ACIQF5_05880 [Streptomyces goshikiensis]|uniref:hypothetical protein n=1 Tax=Streptomyces goshikiensis TaxID=1942 RepID=UPI0038036707